MTVLAPQAHPCPHCGTATEGDEGTFCCHGCELAAELVRGAGLEAYYASREQVAPRSRGVSTDVSWQTVPLITLDDGTVEARIDVEGFRCASCVWVTEKVLERTDGVESALVSYASGRARLRFDPERVDLASIAERIALLGYRPQPAGQGSDVDHDLLTRLGVASFAAMNVMGLSAALYTGWLDGMDLRFAQLFRWLSLLVATPAVTWSAAPFFGGAWQSLRRGVLHMDLPIAMAVGLLYAHGVVATVMHADAYLDSVTMLVALLLGGRLLEARGRKHTADAAAAIAARVPRRARRVVGEGVEDVDTADLLVGDLVEVGLGSEVPADGVVASGSAQLQMALVTGEAAPVSVASGDRVVAGAVVLDGTVRVAVSRTGDDTMVGRMAQLLDLVDEAPRVPSAADRLAPAFTAGTLGVAIATGLLVGATAGVDEALARMVAVLVVACPCALALARPLVGAAGIAAAARRGLLVRDVDVLESLADIDAVLLDKTGTLTGGVPRIVEASDAALRIAAGLERASRHPVAAAVLDEAVRRGLAVPVCDDAREVAGRGVQGTIDGVTWAIRSAGAGTLAVASADGQVHLIRTQDVPREGVAVDLEALRAQGCSVEMITGDHADVAHRVAEAAGVDAVSAAAMPTDKVGRVRELLARDQAVVFVGDGVNDAPAIAEATVGIAMASGVPATIQAADAVLVGERVAAVAEALRVAKLVQRRVRFNLIRSVTYNVLAVTAAVLGYINPLVAAILMPLSSGLVIASAAGLERDLAQGET